ncbi:MAG: hypothetical protein ABIS59_01690 [Candidatus Saccharibacteria bacterium]
MSDNVVDQKLVNALRGVLLGSRQYTMMRLLKLASRGQKLSRLSNTYLAQNLSSLTTHPSGVPLLRSDSLRDVQMTHDLIDNLVAVWELSGLERFGELIDKLCAGLAYDKFAVWDEALMVWLNESIKIGAVYNSDLTSV